MDDVTIRDMSMVSNARDDNSTMVIIQYDNTICISV